MSELLAAANEAFLNQRWDVIVVGTGMGGATLGHKLAAAGQRVLFCEAGPSTLPPADGTRGRYPEMQTSATTFVRCTTEQLRAAGRSTQTIIDGSRRKATGFTPFVGGGTGGSSALYGMALERFFPCDFAPRPGLRGFSDESTHAEWPISYDQLAPYYAAAEKLYRVRGSDDPLRDARPRADTLLVAPALTEVGSALFSFLQARGLHPYQLPMACDFVSGCTGCQGYLCAKGCKNDSAKICLAPAVTEHGAGLLDSCEVLALETEGRRVCAVVCRWQGQTVKLRARTIVLAAGALQSPCILLNSVSAQWPRGLANGSGMVGRNLMRHFIDLYMIDADTRAGAIVDNRRKELAFNDFYQTDGMKLGSVQSFGRLPPSAMLFDSLRQDIKDSAFAWAAPLVGAARPFLMRTLNGMEQSPVTLATTIEDLPYLDNRIAPAQPSGLDVSRIAMHYTVRDEARLRIKHMQGLMSNALKGQRWRRIKQAENNQRIAHACGTCRFGIDAQRSVLNAQNRAHEVDNLYVVDSSFFPSSGGTNPSLTIAANALRVADHLIEDVS